MKSKLNLIYGALSFLIWGVSVADGIKSPSSDQLMAEFDIIKTKVTLNGNKLLFSHHLNGEAGAVIPGATGQLEGAGVFSYVWPTTLNSSSVGFLADQGILALVVTAHPDFDDTPLYDEDQDGANDNDGYVWHSHWVVLAPDDACGAGALKVKDMPVELQTQVPQTWPGLPLFLDSPDYTPSLNEKMISVEVPTGDISGFESFKYDGVTAALKVNANMHSPLLCVTDVFDVASGDLSLPGTVK
ncbi:MAG: hypothetical protein OEX00_00835 [Gammaproteobacteria bacterium]|nr:hypothetical protein [Gammaproteobacteria bacterium]MDH5692670.1 hypothetical protein [Gammaproteobacteria bacterium]